jgi:hypothetical protein
MRRSWRGTGNSFGVDIGIIEIGGSGEVVSWVVVVVVVVVSKRGCCFCCFQRVATARAEG